MASTRANPSRSLRWLFFNPANTNSSIYDVLVPGYPEDISVVRLDWVKELKKRFDFRAKESTITFRRPKPPLPLDSVDEDWINGVQDLKSVASFCQPAFLIVDIFDDKSFDVRSVHLIITAEELVDDTSQTETVGEGDHVPPLHTLHRRFREGREPISVPPSTAAKSTEYARLQQSPKTAIYDGFYAHGRGDRPTIATIAPPVEIFHPVFQQFLDRINNPAFKPASDILPIVSQLMPATTEIHPSEDIALTKLRPLLSDLLGTCVVQIPSTGTRNPDGVALKMLGNRSFPFVCIEYKRAFGEGGCDPLTQAAYSFREFLFKSQCKAIVDKCCCPAFLLAGGGAYLSILGTVYTDKFVVQRLTDIKWIGEATTHEDRRVYHLARLFTSLRLAVEALDEYYGRVWKDQSIPVLIDKEPHPRFFPYPTSFEEYTTEASQESKCTEFKYIDIFRADPANVTFLAQVMSSDRKLVIKFVDRYGVEAHELLAPSMAPRLLYCGQLDGKSDVRGDAGSCIEDEINPGGLYDGPMRMVVMEYIDGTTAMDQKAWPEDVRKQTEKAIQKLHDAQLVYGDLRAPNVMLSGGKVFLIDFDWAGKVGKVHYPRNLSRGVSWAEGVEELRMRPILQKHDLTMLDKLFPVGSSK